VIEFRWISTESFLASIDRHAALRPHVRKVVIEYFHSHRTVSFNFAALLPNATFVLLIGNQPLPNGLHAVRRLAELEVGSCTSSWDSEAWPEAMKVWTELEVLKLWRVRQNFPTHDDSSNAAALHPPFLPSLRALEIIDVHLPTFPPIFPNTVQKLIIRGSSLLDGESFLSFLQCHSRSLKELKLDTVDFGQPQETLIVDAAIWAANALERIVLKSANSMSSTLLEKLGRNVRSIGITTEGLSLTINDWVNWARARSENGMAVRELQLWVPPHYFLGWMQESNAKRLLIELGTELRWMDLESGCQLFN
jgi:hypothetical protein